MKIRLPLLLLFSGLSLFAQIAVKLEAPYPVYMKYDAVHVRIVLRNYTSHPIAFGSSKNLQGEIQFNILTPARTIARLSDRSLRPRLQGVILAPGEARSFTFNLARTSTFRRRGSTPSARLCVIPSSPLPMNPTRQPSRSVPDRPSGNAKSDCRITSGRTRTRPFAAAPTVSSLSPTDATCITA